MDWWLLDEGTGSEMFDWRTAGMLPVEVLTQCAPSASDRYAPGSESSGTLQSWGEKMLNECMVDATILSPSVYGMLSTPAVKERSSLSLIGLNLNS